MKLLLDANLSYRLVKKLENICSVCNHVSRTGLPIPATDIAIWNWAKQHDFIVVTNDDDFYHFSNLYGFPPKVILLRMGNQTSDEIVTIFQKYQGQIADFGGSDEYGLLELF